MSESSQAHRVALLFTQYWARDHGQTSLAAIRAGIGPGEKGEATALMFEAFTDVVGVALDVYDVRHQQIWADAWQQFRSMSKIGKLWWSTDNLAEAETWKADLTAKGAQVELQPEADGSIVRAIITLERSRAEEIMGYKVGDDEWLIEEDAIGKTSCYVHVSGNASDVEDDGVQGFYQIDVSFAHPVVLDVLSDAEKSEIAKAVLDSFHSHQGISVLDDFEIRAFLPDGSDLNEVEDVADARLVLRAEHLGQVNASDLPFLAASETERFWEVVVPYFGLDTSFDYDANPVRIKEYLADYDQNRGHHSGVPVDAVHAIDRKSASSSQVSLFVLFIKTDDEAYATVSGEAYSVAEASAAASNKYPVTYPEPYDSIGCGYGPLRDYVEKECKRLANNFGLDWECVNSNELIFKIFDGDIETREQFVDGLGKSLEVVKTFIPNFKDIWPAVIANAHTKSVLQVRDDSPSP